MIGYNPQQADKVMDAIRDQYNELELYIPAQWEVVQGVLRAEWIGVDEQDFEFNFIERLYTLQYNVYKLTIWCSRTISQLVDDWMNFQKHNSLSGGEITNDKVINVNNLLDGIRKRCRDILNGVNEIKELTKDIFPIKYIQMDIPEDAVRGLQHGTSSAANIQNAVGTFVQNIQNKVKNLFESVTVNKAFFGDYATSVKKYIDDCADAIAVISTSVKDLNDALEHLAGSQYTAASTTSADTMSASSSSVETELGNYSNSRWT